ncbi:MAG TPA: hypothetical protein VFR86_12125 [Burkholderiaceae bacterium]|nr:hypothetical protein [Burkholderiaceae bacterium]
MSRAVRNNGAHKRAEKHSTKPAVKRVPKRAAKRAPGAAAEPRLSHRRPPAAMPVPDWQRALRRQFGREQDFEMENIGTHPVFSEFRVHNPASGGRYRVAIRGTQPGENYCACADFATNALGTCKHIEYTLARLAAKRTGKAALARGYAPPFSEVFLHYGVQRTVRFRAGTECRPTVKTAAERLFDAETGWVLPPTRLAALDDFIVAAHATGHELRV